MRIPKISVAPQTSRLVLNFDYPVGDAINRALECPRINMHYALLRENRFRYQNTFVACNPSSMKQDRRQSFQVEGFACRFMWDDRREGSQGLGIRCWQIAGQRYGFQIGIWPEWHGMLAQSRMFCAS